MDYNINGYAEGQKLNVISRTIAAQTIDYLTAHFDFTPDWTGATIFAHFRQGDTVYDLMLNEDGDILESQHLSLSDGTWELYLHGNKYDGDTVTQRITTTIARVQVFRTGYFGDEPLPVEPSVGEQILAAAMYARDQIDNLTAEADTLPEGSEAAASYDKIEDKILFGIPKGEKGEAGEQGPQGEPFTLEDFEQTETYQTIVTNEQARVQAEGERESAEESRGTAEQNRVTAEEGRVSAETDRVSAESSRVSAEAERVSAESARETAEAGRVSAEESRVTAESERVTAEEERATEFAGFEGEINEIKKKTEAISDFRNLWTYGAVEGTAYIEKDIVLTSGKTYVVGGILASEDTQSPNSRISFLDSESNELKFALIGKGVLNYDIFVAPENVSKIRIYASNTETSSQGDGITISEFYLEDSAYPLDERELATAKDNFNRKETETINEKIQELYVGSKNLWTFGDVSGATFVQKPFKTTAGHTYTFSGIINSEATSGYSRIDIVGEDGTYDGSIVHVNNLMQGSRNSVSLTPSEDGEYVRIYASNSVSSSYGKSFTVEDFQIEEGSTPTEYEKPFLLKSEKPYFTRSDFFEDSVVVGNGNTVSFTIEKNKEENKSMIISSWAKFTKNAGVTDYPRIRAGIYTDKNLFRSSTWYKLGEENSYEIHEMRCPAYFDNRKIHVEIKVPVGCTLYIKDLHNYFENNVLRFDNGISFNARNGDCNVIADQTIDGFNMAVKNGYNTLVVIPKVSSDGVWFCYHDDTFVSSKFANEEGEPIENAPYEDGTRFSSIPWSYLSGLCYKISYGANVDFQHLTKLEDFLLFCAKNGLYPMFSMHPHQGVTDSVEKMQALKSLIGKYGLLDKFKAKMAPTSDTLHNLENVFGVFGNEIYSYTIDSTESMDDPSVVIDKYNTFLLSHEVTAKCGVEFWSDQLLNDQIAGKALVDEALESGFFVACAESSSTIGVDGTSHGALWGEDFNALIKLGVTEFTCNSQTSTGLNW